MELAIRHGCAYGQNDRRNEVSLLSSSDDPHGMDTDSLVIS